jgi:hypothetical protein
LLFLNGEFLTDWTFISASIVEGCFIDTTNRLKEQTQNRQKRGVRVNFDWLSVTYCVNFQVCVCLLKRERRRQIPSNLRRRKSVKVSHRENCVDCILSSSLYDVSWTEIAWKAVIGRRRESETLKQSMESNDRSHTLLPTIMRMRLFQVSLLLASFMVNGVSFLDSLSSVRQTERFDCQLTRIPWLSLKYAIFFNAPLLWAECLRSGNSEILWSPYSHFPTWLACYDVVKGVVVFFHDCF